MNPQSNQKCFNQILKGGILIEVVLQFHQPKSQANKQYHAASYNTIEFLVTHVVLEISYKNAHYHLKSFQPTSRPDSI